MEKVKAMKKSELKEKLVKLGLISEKSNAPVKVLRDIYLFYDTNDMIIISK